MSNLEINTGELQTKTLETKRKLNSTAYDLRGKINAYGESKGQDKSQLYRGLVDVFSRHAAVYDLLLRELSGEEKFAQSNVYSTYVCSVYGSEKFSGLEERTLKTKGFFDGISIDLTTTSPNPASKLLDLYMDVVRICSNSKEHDLDSLTTEYFQWMYDETQKYSEEKFMLGLQMKLTQNPIILKEANGIDRKFNKLTKDAPSTDNKEYSWDKLGGYEEQKEKCQEIENCIRNYEFLKRRQKQPIPKGIILHGPPGTGKTTFAKTIAYQAGVPFEYISRQDIASSFKDGSTQKIAETFTRVKSYITKGLAPAAILAIDEIDGLLCKRDGKEKENDKEVNVLLTEMDGKNVEGLVVIGMTNRIEAIDTAALRPGRFEKQIEIGLPDVSTRSKIFEVVFNEAADYARLNHNGEEILGNINYELLGKQTEGFSGDHIQIIPQIAVKTKSFEYLRTQKQPHPITTKDIQNAIKKLKSESKGWID